MSVETLNFTIDQGTDYEVTLTITGDDHAALNLTGYSVESFVRKHYTSKSHLEFDVTFVNRLTGQISLSMPSNRTSLLKEGRYVYDVVLLSPSNIKTRVVQGSILVNPGVTLDE